MNTKYILAASGIFLGLLGILWSFLPEEINNYFGYSPSSISMVFFKILGALYLGGGFLNWYSKESLIGGIYNRPLAFFNTVHFTIGSITLIRFLFKTDQINLILLALSFFYAIFAMLFFKILFTTPKEVTK